MCVDLETFGEQKRDEIPKASACLNLFGFNGTPDLRLGVRAAYSN